MTEAADPITFWQYFITVLRRAVVPFSWTRDIMIATGLTLITVFLQAHYKLIPDWEQHRRLYLLSYLIPYVLILVPHWMYRLAEAPWRIHQEQDKNYWGVQKSTNDQLLASQAQNDLLRERIGRQTWPENRPQLTFERWGHLIAGGVSRPERGFYLTNHGGVALEVTVEDFALGGKKWVSRVVSSIQSQQTGLAIVERENCSPAEGAGCWLITEAFQAAKKTEFPISVKYRDFNNNWYRSKAIMRCDPDHGSIAIGPATQEKLGSS